MYGPDLSISTVTSLTVCGVPLLLGLLRIRQSPTPRLTWGLLGTLSPLSSFFSEQLHLHPSPMATPPIRPLNVLNVAPLNSIPYVDPLGTNNNSNTIHREANNGPANHGQQFLLYLPYQPTEEELNNVLSVTNNGVMLGGSAAKGLLGPVIGKLDIGEDDTSYIFRVGLPGVAREEFSCDVAPDGQILIKGITTTGEKAVYKDSMKFEMMTQNLCPPGHFSITFKLPGPVDSQQLDAVLGIDGVFEGIVKKKKSMI